METEQHECYICAWGLCSAHVWLLIGGSVSENLQKIQDSWVCCSSCGVHLPFRAFDSSIMVSNLCPMLGCEGLHLSQSAARESVLHDSYARLLPASITECRELGSLSWHGSLAGSVTGWPFPPFLLHLSPGTSCRQINCGPNILWVSLCPHSFIRSLAWVQGYFRFHISYC